MYTVVMKTDPESPFKLAVETARVYPIVDLFDFEKDRQFIEELLRGGIRIVQLRGKHLAAFEFESAVSKLLAACPKLREQAAVIINDSIDVCCAVGAAGVHLGQSDQNPLTAREILGERAIIGYSTHNLDQVRQAQKLPVSYLGFGPVFISPTKQGHAPETGIAQLAEAVSISQIPIVAIGGITIEIVSAVYRARPAAAAIISDLRLAGDAAERLKQYRLTAAAAGTDSDDRFLDQAV